MQSHVHKLINKHGLTSTYVVITEGVYDVNTSSVTNTETNNSVKLYKKHIRSNQYNFPNLIDKEAAMFYLSGLNLSFIPKAGDYIVYNSEKYKVDSVFEHVALGVTELYRIIGVK